MQAFSSDPLAFYGRRIIEEHHAVLNQLPLFHPNPDLPNPFNISDELLRFLPQLKVGILGAGASGLYTALILDSLDIEYEIIEASDRTGGRLSTYKFPTGGKYDYYEEGAMRFPLPKKNEQGHFRNGTMKRLAELIEYEPLNEGHDRLKDKLIPYYHDAPKGSNPGFYYFNGILQSVSTEPKGSFNAEAMNVPDGYIKAGVDAIIGDVTGQLARMVIEDLKTGETKGWRTINANDSYSFRAYMGLHYLPDDNLELPLQHLPNNVINWCELLDLSRRRYDRGLTEAVISSLEFATIGDIDYGDVDWKCFEGGSETLSKKMEEYIRKRGVPIQFRKRVTAIGQSSMVVSLAGGFPRNQLPSGVEETLLEPADLVNEEDWVIIDLSSTERVAVRVPCVAVTVNGPETKNYSHVISTLPLPVLRTVDLSDAGLSIMQTNALRKLEYDTAVKIAILFKSNWWTTKMGIVGGQSFTDLPIRTVVYPSYGVDSSTPSKVLIASYCPSPDAERLGALAVLKKLEVLKDLVLRNLAEAHGGVCPEITYQYLQDEFEDMHVKDWRYDANSMGAFAYFSPGQFEDLYASLNAPAANNRLHFAGEGVSIRHAWVVGALDSAWRAVYEYLKVTGQDEKIEKFKEIWGENDEWTSKPTLVDPARYGELGPDLLDQHIWLAGKANQRAATSQRN